jgi:hypothetical protein
MSESITKYKAIKDYFGTPGHLVKLEELKALSPADRTELAEGAAKELGKVIAVK